MTVVYSVGMSDFEQQVLAELASLRAVMATKDDLAISQVEILTFMKEHMASKDDLQAVKAELVTHLDGVVSKHVAFDQELLMMRNRQDRIEDRVMVLESA